MQQKSPLERNNQNNSTTERQAVAVYQHLSASPSSIVLALDHTDMRRRLQGARTEKEDEGAGGQLPLPRMLETMHALFRLSLSNCLVGDTEMQILMTALIGSLIQSLVVSHNLITAVGLRPISQYLSKPKLTRLTSINLSNYHIKGKSMGLAEFASFIPFLEFVSLAANPLVDGAMLIADALLPSPGFVATSMVRVLDLSSTDASAEAVEKLSQAQSRIGFLAFLDIRFNDLPTNHTALQIVSYHNRESLQTLGVLNDDKD